MCGKVSSRVGKIADASGKAGRVKLKQGFDHARELLPVNDSVEGVDESSAPGAQNIRFEPQRER
jgi:hypothetical protein